MKDTNYQPLIGQVALVTGASSGIGAGVAKALAGAGASVAVNHPGTPEPADKVVEEIRAAGGTAIALAADVSNEDQVKKMYADLFAAYGTIDILVANAGLQKDAALIDMSLAEWQFVLNVNLTGQFLCAREAAREFMRRGVVSARSVAAGKIICMSSVHEVIPWAGHCNYAASKGGIMLMMKSICARAGASQNQGQQHRPWCNQDAHQPGRMGDARGRSRTAEAHSLPARRRPGRHSASGSVASVRRIGLCYWNHLCSLTAE